MSKASTAAVYHNSISIQHNRTFCLQHRGEAGISNDGTCEIQACHQTMECSVELINPEEQINECGLTSIWVVNGSPRGTRFGMISNLMLTSIDVSGAQVGMVSFF